MTSQLIDFLIFISFKSLVREPAMKDPTKRGLRDTCPTRPALAPVPTEQIPVISHGCLLLLMFSRTAYDMLSVS